MRVVLQQPELATAVAAAARVAPSRPIRPVFGAVLLAARGGELLVGASDQETVLRTSVPAEVSEEGQAVVPARVLLEAARRMPSGAVELQSAADGAGLQMHAGTARMSIHGFAPADFPAIPPFPDKGARTYPAAAVKRAIQHSAFAAAQSETARALLRGVELRLAEDAIFTVATDGFQVAAYSSQRGAPRPAEGGVVVLARVLEEVARFLGDGQETCQVALEGNRVLVRQGATYLGTRVLEGKYFSVLDMLPREFPTRMTVDREAFTEACERVGLVSEQEPPYTIMVDVGKDVVTLHAESGDVGEAYEELPADVVGEGLSLGFNVRQLVQGLRHFSGARVQLEFSGPETAAQVTDPADGCLQYVQMPLQLRAREESA